MSSDQSPHIAIIGSGLGGLTVAISLKRKYGYKNFTIYEKASEIGGTWRDNVYPGAASDVPIHLYTLSIDLDYRFKHSHGTSAEIKEYWHRLATKYDLYQHIVFNTKIVSAEWSKKDNEYSIVAIDTRTTKVARDLIDADSDGEKKTYKARVLISAHGILEIPHPPEIPGVEDFKGQIFHSARWDWNIDLKGKKVCVIGNGSSSAQFVPIITEDPTMQVTQFIRTPSWYRIDPWKHYSPMWQGFFKWFPIFLQLKRWAIWTELELNWFLLRSKFLNGLLVRPVRFPLGPSWSRCLTFFKP
jgi:cation diffusion facilitator CzcD-associated flavoprotein CzcO